MSAHCQRCGGAHDNAHAEATCAYRATTRDLVRETGKTSIQPPTVAQVEDLWAHLNGIYDIDAALRALRLVLDLGWRPADFSPTTTDSEGKS